MITKTKRFFFIGTALVVFFSFSAGQAFSVESKPQSDSKWIENNSYPQNESEAKGGNTDTKNRDRNDDNAKKKRWEDEMERRRISQENLVKGIF